MKIEFILGWVPKGIVSRRHFKDKMAGELFFNYLQRISKFAACSPVSIKALEKSEYSRRVWICDTKRGESWTTEELANRLNQLCLQGIHVLQICIGGADGMPEGSYPDAVFWSFGPLTLPHELAAIVASEQIYRAWTILYGLPYHINH